MAARPEQITNFLTKVIRTVETGQTVAVGRVVKDGNADGEVQHSADGVGAIGVCMELGPLAGAAGDKVLIGLFAPIVPMLVGTGGATRGKFAKVVADGVTDATESVTTPVAADIVGIFTQSGVAADRVGVQLLRGWVTE